MLFSTLSSSLVSGSDRSTIVIDPAISLVEVGCAGLGGNVLEAIGIDTVVLRDGHVPDIAGIWINVTEFDVSIRIRGEPVSRSRSW